MCSEGWNTTRPNVSLFLNIGVDKEARTFVTQSLGRTLRIVSYGGDRRRAAFRGVKGQEANVALETSFIFASNPSAIQAIIESTNSENLTQNRSRIELEKNLKKNKNMLDLFLKSEYY